MRILSARIFLSFLAGKLNILTRVTVTNVSISIQRLQ